MKKSQLMVSKTLVFSLITIISAAIIIFGFKGIQEIQKNNIEIQQKLFIDSLKKTINAQKAYPIGSTSETTLSLSPKIESICFAQNTNFNPLTNAELNSQISMYKEFNLFFFPMEDNLPQELKGFETYENPLCIKNINGRVRLKLRSLGNATLISSSEKSDEISECISVAYNGEDKIDIVFLNYGYDKIDDFARDVNDYIINIFSTVEPYADNIDKFNFYRIDNLIGDICEVKSFVLCDEYEAKKIASNCPNDYIFILVDRNKVADLVKPVRSSAISNMAKINTADNKFVILHEFGHVIAELADEYVDDSYYSKFDFNEEDYPNCDSIQCYEWSDVKDTGCFSGCSLSNFYRPTETSLMKTLKSKFYGPVNENEINKKIEAYK